MKKTKVSIVSHPEGEWLAIYVNGKGIYQDYSIGYLEFLLLSEKHGFTSSDIIYTEASHAAAALSKTEGCFPVNLSDMLE